MNPKRSRRILQCCLIVLGVVVSIGSFASSQTPAKSDPCTRILPANLRKEVEAEFPSWRPKRLSDLHSDDRQLWQNARARECPGIAVGHFKSVASLSYALLLVPEKDPTRGYKLLFVEQQSSPPYQSVVLDQNDDQDSASMVISKAPPGKYSDFEQTRTVRIRLDTINVEWLEKAAVTYYWSNGQFLTLQTSD